MTNPALHAEMRGPVSQTRGFSVATNDMILGSVDSHVIEPPTMFDARNPENYRDQAPSVRENGTQYGQLFLRAKETRRTPVCGRPTTRTPTSGPAPTRSESSRCRSCRCGTLS